MWERLYAIYDTQAEAILKGGGSIPLVIMYPNDNVARREFIEIVKSVPHIQKHINDFKLILIGRINIETAETLPVSDGQPAHDSLCLVMHAKDAYQQDERQLDIGEQPKS